MLDFCEFFYCISKIKFLDFLHKCDSISSFSTAKAFENPFTWRNHKGRSFFIMKRTSTRIVASSSGEWHISFDQIFDFDWCEDFFDKRIVCQNRNEKVINIPYYMIFYWFVKRKVKKLILEVKIRLKVRFLFLLKKLLQKLTYFDFMIKILVLF